MRYGFVYIWFDRKHARYYIGSHWGTEDDGYVCSSRWMRNAFNRRPNDFKRRIVSRVYTNRKDLLDEEFSWLEMIKEEEIDSRKYYNRTKHRNGHWSAENYERDIRKRISDTTKTSMARPEVREKFLEGLKTRDCKSSDPEVREKRRRSMVKTMAEKYPIEDRWKKLTEDERKSYYSEKAKTNWEKPGFREKTSASIRKALERTKEHRSKLMSSLKWYNDGSRSVRRSEHPGEGWELGRA